MIIIPIFLIYHNSDSTSLLWPSHFPLDLSTFHTLYYTTAKTKIHYRSSVSESDISVECRLVNYVVLLSIFIYHCFLCHLVTLLIIWSSHLLSRLLIHLSSGLCHSPPDCYVCHLVCFIVHLTGAILVIRSVSHCYLDWYYMCPTSHWSVLLIILIIWLFLCVP